MKTDPSQTNVQIDMRSERIVTQARLWLGTPYRHQMSALGAGTDCLGLVRGIWRAVVGPEPVVPPPYTMDWSEPSQDEVLMTVANTWLVRKTEPRLAPGDILLFRMREGSVAKHLGVVVSLVPITTFIHAYTGHGVVESPLSSPWARKIAAVYRFPEESV